jgi:hypothetical protein
MAGGDAPFLELQERCAEPGVVAVLDDGPIQARDALGREHGEARGNGVGHGRAGVQRRVPVMWLVLGHPAGSQHLAAAAADLQDACRHWRQVAREERHGVRCGNLGAWHGAEHTRRRGGTGAQGPRRLA